MEDSLGPEGKPAKEYYSKLVKADANGKDQVFDLGAHTPKYVSCLSCLKVHYLRDIERFMESSLFLDVPDSLNKIPIKQLILSKKVGLYQVISWTRPEECACIRRA